ncbi:MAG: ATP-binding cassette domain-containing protein [Tepidamorphaceae bacterium]
MTGVPKISVRDLTMRYGDTLVLERISIDVPEGAFCTLVGASGCGKSTFLRLLLSQERPSGGVIEMDGAPLPEEPTPDRGIVFQKYSVLPHLSVEDNLILAAEFERAPVTGRLFAGSRRTPGRTLRKSLNASAWRLRASVIRRNCPVACSSALAIAQALLKRPTVLLLDEPFGALDPGIRIDMHEILQELWREMSMTVFMVTHDIQEAFKLGTRLLVFDKVRHDPHAPEAYGATITYDIPLDRNQKPQPPASLEELAGAAQSLRNLLEDTPHDG